MSCRHLSPMFGVALCLAAASSALAAQESSQRIEPNLTDEQKEAFLLKAQVVKSKPIGKGVTSPWRLTLSDGALTHDAAFVSVDEHRGYMRFESGESEVGFRDSYHYDIAGRELAKLIGLGDMIPVTVERKWAGHVGALSWWIPWKWDEETRLKQNLHPPDVKAWNNQMHKVRVFHQLIYNTDPNVGNLLITEDWKLWMIDFTRAFRLRHELRNPGDLTNCDRALLEKLRQLDGTEVLARTKAHLTKDEVKAVIARRDKIVQYFEKLFAEKGENAVLY